MAVGRHRIGNCLVTFLGYHGLGDEEGGSFDILPVRQAVLDVGGQALGIVAPVLLHHGHFAVLYLDAGLQVQQVGPQGCGGGAAAALYQVVQLVHQEAGLHTGGKPAQVFRQGIQRLGSLGQLHGLQHHQALAGGEILGVDAADIVKFPGGETGVLVAGGKAGADADVDNAVIAVRILGKGILVEAHAAGCGGAQAAAGSHMGENIGRGDGDTVVEFLLVFHNDEGDQGNVMLLQQLRRQVTGAVGNYFDVHSVTPYWLWRRGRFPSCSSRAPCPFSEGTPRPSPAWLREWA